MNPLEHDQIENERYLDEAFFVLPLVTGRIAILTPRRELFKIVDDWNEAKALGPLAGRAVSRPVGPLVRSRIKLDLEELL